MASEESSTVRFDPKIFEALMSTPESVPRPFYLVLAWEVPTSNFYQGDVIDKSVLGAIEQYPYVRPLSRVAFLAIQRTSDAVGIRSVLDYIADKVHPDSLLYILSPPQRATAKWGGRVSEWPLINRITDREATVKLPPGELSASGT